MKNPIKLIYNSTKEILSKKSYKLLFLFIAVIVLAIYIIIPVFSIPGNDFLFQLSIFTFKDFIVLIPFSLLVSLMISMQIYSYKQRKSLRLVGKSVVGGYSGIVAGVFGTASCSSCVAAIFGFLGTGSVLFLIANQWWVVSIAGLLVILSLYLTSIGIDKQNS